MTSKSRALTIGRLRGAPVRLHWSVPLGVLVFTRFRLAPGAWLAFVIVLLAHELGHALAVVRGGLRLTSVDVLGVGGLCRFEGYPTPRRRVLIAWAGVIAQAAILLITAALVLVLGRPAHAFAADAVYALTWANGWLILVNLVPIPPLDGAEAWALVPLITAARARRRLDAEEARASRERAAARAALPPAPTSTDDLDAEDLPPMPEEVRRVLDRIMAEGRAEHESAKKK